MSEDYGCTAVKYIVDSCFVDCFKKPNGTEGIDYMLIPVFFHNTSAGLNLIQNNDPMGIYFDNKIFQLEYANLSGSSLMFRYSKNDTYFTVF